MATASSVWHTDLVAGDTGDNVSVNTAVTRTAGTLLKVSNNSSQRLALAPDGAMSLAGGLGIFGATAVTSQPNAISNVSGGLIVDSEGRTAINAILAVLRNYGLLHS